MFRPMATDRALDLADALKDAISDLAYELSPEFEQERDHKLEERLYNALTIVTNAYKSKLDDNYVDEYPWSVQVAQHLIKVMATMKTPKIVNIMSLYITCSHRQRIPIRNTTASRNAWRETRKRTEGV